MTPGPATTGRLLALLAERGGGAYFGEAVTEAEHALQCAALAAGAGAGPELVAAALLHDVGHLLHGLPEDFSARGLDDRHEDGGAAWLAADFPPAVTDPVRLHVAAKRYLCATDPAYAAALSPASRLSLERQGGPLTPAAAAAFDREPHAAAALRLRRWDDAAKVPGLPVPPAAAYRDLLDAVRTRAPA